MIFRLRYFLFPMLFILAGVSGVQGQILNIEKTRLDSLNPQKPYSVKIEANVDFYNRSATEDDQAKFISTEASLNGTYAPGKHTYLILGEMAYVENNSKNILNNGNLHLRTTFFYRERFSPEAFVQGQYDNFRGLTDRVLAGVAIRWKIIRAEDFDWVLGTGPMYEYERWRMPETKEIVQVRLPKWSTYTTFRWTITETIDFNSIVYYQVGYDNSIELTRHRVSNNTNFNIKITEKLAFHTGISMAYEDEPIVPITRFIYSVENGISFNF